MVFLLNFHVPWVCIVEISYVIYAANAIKSLNSVIPISIKEHKILSSDDSVKKVIYLATSNTAKKCTMPIQIGLLFI